MNLLVHTHPLSLWLPDAIAVLAIISSALKAPWRELLAVKARSQLFFGAMLILGLLWSQLVVSVFEIYQIHPLLVSSVVLVFGLPLGLIVGAGASIFMHLLAGLPWENIGFHYMINCVVPALVTCFVLYVIDEIHIQNLFIYLLGASFFGSMFAVMGAGAVALLLLWLSGSTLLWTTLDHAYLFLLLTFPEGFINGAVITTMAVLRPDWVKTYNDSFYLDGK